MCELVNLKKGVINKYGEEFCSVVCKEKADHEAILDEVNFFKAQEERKKQREERINKLESEYCELKSKFEEKYSSFYELIKNVKLKKLKRSLLVGKIKVQEFISDWHQIIEDCSLERSEKDQWKEIYQEENCVGGLDIVVSEERRFLLSLAKQKKLQEKKRENERKEIIREIKQALNLLSPQVELKELPETYHNYESWEIEKLKNQKEGIIEEIRNKREEKKLLVLLIKANDCTDDELQEFIRKLEKFTLEHACEPKKIACRNQRVQVDEVISNLWDRLDDLNEKNSLVILRNNILRSVESWIKEEEDLVFPDCSYREFKKNIENIDDKGLLLSQQNQAFQYLMRKVKDDVKNQFGVEKFNGEYKELDQAENFAEVRLMREIIKTSRLVREGEKSKGRSWGFIEGEINKLKEFTSNNQEVNLSKVNALVEKLEEEIRNAKLAKSQNQEESRPNSSSWLSSHWKEAGVIIIFGFFLVILGIWMNGKGKKAFSSKSN